MPIKNALPKSVVGIARFVKRTFDINTFKRRTVRHNYLGVPLTIHLEDPIGAKWYDQDYNKLEELEYLRTFNQAKPIKSVFELGAHQGVVAIMLRGHFGRDSHVVAVEASPFNYSIANKNIASNNIGGITLLNAAISGEPGEIDFVDNGNGYIARDTSSVTKKIKCVTIDELSDRFGIPDLILLDIEGFEYVALTQGSSQTIKSDAIWLVELHGDSTLSNYGGTNQKCIDLFDGDRFDKHIAVIDENISFRPMNSNRDVPIKRCYFLAMPKSRLQ